MSEPIRDIRIFAGEAAHLEAAVRLLATEFDGPTEDADGEPTTWSLLLQAGVQFRKAKELVEAAYERETQHQRRAALAKAADGGEG